MQIGLRRKSILLTSFLSLCLLTAVAQTFPENYPVVWTSQSRNSAESMPCGGGDIGLNVWVENGELYFYLSQSGAFDEHNTLLKLGRIKLRLSPNPFAGSSFRQELVLRDGYVKISGANGALNASIDIWVDIQRSTVHVDVSSNRKINAEASYESWRYRDRPISGKENNANSWKWSPQRQVIIYRDSIGFDGNAILFYHRNRDTGTVFDAAVAQQQLQSVKDKLYNPLLHLTSGGIMQGKNFIAANTYEGRYADTDFKAWTLKSRKAANKHSLLVSLLSEQASATQQWKEKLREKNIQSANDKTARSYAKTFWNNLWDRSFIYIQPNLKDTSAPEWQAGRNYQLFRYMLACNAFGAWPTKFNGGLFTYDPRFTDSTIKGTPDHRNWGGGTHTAMNQRLLYFALIKSGDTDIMIPQFEFYLRLLHNAELRSQTYWHHNGACFTEQLENFGLPNLAEYGWKRPPGFDAGMEYNAWLEYLWDTVLEFCLMILETERYKNADISRYIPLIESCVRFFNEHYQYLARQRGNKALDGNGHLMLYPGSAGETFKMAYNSTTTIAGLKTVLTRLLELPSKYLSEKSREEYTTMLKRIPPIKYRVINGHTTVAPAKLWERVNHTESVQLYTLFPWGLHGIGKPGYDTALNTWRYDTSVVKNRSHIGWRQENIFAARLGLAKESAALTIAKLKNSGRRFPAFWGPGYDWTPDHSWGGSGMIGLQEMLLQADGKKILLFPAWPKDWDVHFKLHAPYNTTVEAELKNGEIKKLIVLPEERRNDIISMMKM